VGAYLTQQLPVQQYTAIYFCIVDGILLTQWIYYRKIHPPDKSIAPLIETHYVNTYRTTGLGVIFFLVIINIISLPVLVQHTANSPLRGISHWDSSSHTMRELLQQKNITLPHCEFKPTLPDWVKIIGDVCAWLSAVLYLAARGPQIYLNYRRKTVKGVSMIMFILMNFANIFYGTYVVMILKDFSSSRFWISDFPFLFGSYGAVFPNTFVLCQWWYYDYHLKGKIYRYDDDEVEIIEK